MHVKIAYLNIFIFYIYNSQKSCFIRATVQIQNKRKMSRFYQGCAMKEQVSENAVELSVCYRKPIIKLFNRFKRIACS